MHREGLKGYCLELEKVCQWVESSVSTRTMKLTAPNNKLAILLGITFMEVSYWDVTYITFMEVSYWDVTYITFMEVSYWDVTYITFMEVSYV